MKTCDFEQQVPQTIFTGAGEDRIRELARAEIDRAMTICGMQMTHVMEERDTGAREVPN